ncbi:MAG: alpha/beta hydrolase fold domain-containing protein [Pseudolabrys sp.]
MSNAAPSPMPEIPATLRKVMAEIGPRWGQDVRGHIKLMLEEFSKVLANAPRDGVAVTTNVRYGEHERHELDIFTPANGGTKRPALLFVHGGAFLDGNRNRTEQIYSNVLYYFARHGIVGVNIGYRLAGDATYPGATVDVGNAVRYVREHADEMGIDRDRIFLMGHSAGCAHAGSYAYDKRLQPAEGHGLRGFIIVSGRVRADVFPDNPNAKRVETYYETADMAKLDALSPVSHVDADSVATFVAWGEYENPLLDIHCAELVYRLGQAKRHTPPMIWLKGHNHTSTIAHFNTAEDQLGRAILAFIDDPR